MGGEGGRRTSSRKEEGGRLISQLLESLTTSVTFSFSKCSSIRLWLNHMVHGKFSSPSSFSQKPSTWTVAVCHVVVHPVCPPNSFGWMA